jgi:hypothetical protein
MRPIALIALLMLSSGAWAIADTLTGQSDATEYVTLPEGNGSLYLSGDTDETCSLEMQDAGGDPVALAEYDDTTVAAGVSVRLDFGGGQKVRVSCTDTTEMTVSVEIWPLREKVDNVWVERHLP